MATDEPMSPHTPADSAFWTIVWTAAAVAVWALVTAVIAAVFVVGVL